MLYDLVCLVNVGSSDSSNRLWCLEFTLNTVVNYFATFLRDKSLTFCPAIEAEFQTKPRRHSFCSNIKFAYQWSCFTMLNALDIYYVVLLIVVLNLLFICIFISFFFLLVFVGKLLHRIVIKCIATLALVLFCFAHCLRCETHRWNQLVFQLKDPIFFGPLTNHRYDVIFRMILIFYK